MQPHTPRIANGDTDQGHTGAATEPSPRPRPRPRVWHWVRLTLLAVPCLGLAMLSLAPWLFPGPPVGHFTVSPPRYEEVGDRLIGPVRYTLDARAAEQWTFFDFSRGSVVDIPHQFEIAWDLAFQRHKILANGGATNPKGRGAIMDLGAVAFDEIQEAPLEGYLEDTIATITPETITTENPAIKAWYRYNFLTHVLQSKAHVYAVRTADGKYAKMRLLSYYCDGGQASGCFTLEYVYQGDGSRRLVAQPPQASTPGPQQ